RVDGVLADDICVVGLESTIVKVADGRVSLLREGGLARESIEAVVGPIDGPALDAKEEAPGMAHRHYAPSVPLRLDADDARDGEAWLGFGGALPSVGAPAHAADLSHSGDTTEAAANLFAMLHDLDASGATGIAVAPVPHTGTGAAINDRLRRAAEASVR
ncbi:translation factor Sua5, partial [Rhizobiaceae bacterium]|nr:translation factor Sua5 [Rhizobiaceae bacterium]